MNFRRGHFFDARIWALIIPAMLVLGTDLPVLLTLLYALSAILIVVAMTHCIRRVIFHYLDLDDLALKASVTPTGAALVFVGVCMVVSSIVLASAIWIAK